MSFNKQSSNSDIDSTLFVDDPSDLSGSSLSNSSSSSSSSSEEIDISVIPINYDKDLEKIITELKIDRQHLEGLNLLYRLNSLNRRNRGKYTKLIFPEIYRLAIQFNIEEKNITNIIYSNSCLKDLLQRPLRAMKNLGKDRYDPEKGKWVKTTVEDINDSLLKMIVTGEYGDPPILSIEGIRNYISKYTQTEIERKYTEIQRQHFLNETISEDEKYKNYLSEILNIPYRSITNPWGGEKGNQGEYMITTTNGSFGILPFPLKNYLQSISTEGENMIYLRYGSIPDGDCLFHSYLDATDPNYFQKSSGIKGKKDKQNIMGKYRKWLKDNLSEYDYDYLNPHISNALGNKKNFEDYAKHFGNITEWGWDLDIPYLMNISDYYSSESYNIFLFAFDPRRIPLQEEGQGIEDYGKYFIQLLPHYNYDEKRKNIFIFNKDGSHFESIIHIPLPDGMPTFSQWSTEYSSKLKLSKKERGKHKKTAKKDSLTKFKLNKEYLVDNHINIFPYDSSEQIIRNLVTHIQETGESHQSWQQFPIRNWEKLDSYTCGKYYKKSDGYAIPNHRGVCPAENPWRFKIGISDNFCCTDTKEKANNAIKSLPIEGQYKDINDKEIPRVIEVTDKIINENTYKEILERKKSLKKKTESELKELRKELKKRGKKTKGYEYYESEEWVKQLIQIGYINSNGSNFEKFDIYYQLRPKGILKTQDDVLIYMTSKFDLDTDSLSSSQSSGISSSTKESSSSSNEIDNAIFIDYLSGNQTLRKKIEKGKIIDFIKKDFPLYNNFFINIVNNPRGYQGCSDMKDIIKELNVDSNLNSIQLDNNEMTNIDESLGEFCPCYIDLSKENLSKIIKVDTENIHSNVARIGDTLRFKAYYGNICEQSLSNGIHLDSVISIYMYPKDNYDSIKRIAVSSDFEILKENITSKTKKNNILKYKDIYFLGEENGYQELKNLLENGIWKTIDSSDDSSSGGRKKNTNKNIKKSKKTKKSKTIFFT